LKVYEYILSRKKMHMTLIDPDKQEPAVSADVASRAADAGTGAIMVGGSTGVTSGLLDATVRAIKGAVDIPVIHFPTTSRALSPNVDAIYFMSMLNSTDRRYLIGEHVKAARYIRSSGIEAIPMGYIIVEPGMTVGRVGSAEPVPRDSPDLAADYAMAGELLGMRMIYLEAGSGAPQPVPPEMVSEVRRSISVPLVVGGGIRTPEQASAAARAGADVVVTGTIVEQVEEVYPTLKDIVDAIG